MTVELPSPRKLMLCQHCAQYVLFFPSVLNFRLSTDANLSSQDRLNCVRNFTARSLIRWRCAHNASSSLALPPSSSSSSSSPSASAAVVCTGLDYSTRLAEKGRRKQWMGEGQKRKKEREKEMRSIFESWRSLSDLIWGANTVALLP